MQHPIIAQANAKVRYDQLVQQADHHRQLSRLPKNKTGIIAIFSGLFRLFKSETAHAAPSNTTA
jgi:hypothetical protein